MPDAPPRIICFDLGGVVVRICRSWREACARAGVVVRDEDTFDLPDLRAQRKRLTVEYMAGRIDCAAYWRGVADATGGAYRPEEVEAVHNVWVIEDYPGVASLIGRINEAEGLVSACLSNTNHAHWAPLITGPTPSEAIALIRRRLVSHELGAVKPDEEIYRKAERLLEAAPAEILFFDDTEENIDAARAFGWNAELIDHAGDPAAQAAEHMRAHGVTF